MNTKFWRQRNVLVTGGASFIGSHLVDRLVELGAAVRIADDLSSGKLANIREHVQSGHVHFLEADLREPGKAQLAMQDMDMVFHLAADHGGRGYVDLHQAGPATNLFLGGQVFYAAREQGVQKIVFASSGCVYPNQLQTEPDKEVFLSENMVRPPYDADNMYGWAKLMNELTLKAYHDEFGMETVSCRYFTVYGPRGKEDHALIAMIARAFVRQDPYEIWGDGRQVRNWTYVDDIVAGTILAAEMINDGTALNLGTMERIRVIDAARRILEHFKHKPKIRFLTDMPTGPLNRVADNRLARERIGWSPVFTFAKGLEKTIDWYIKNRNQPDVQKIIDEKSLTER